MPTGRDDDLCFPDEQSCGLANWPDGLFSYLTVNPSKGDDHLTSLPIRSTRHFSMARAGTSTQKGRP